MELLPSLLAQLREVCATFPDSRNILELIAKQAELSAEELYLLARGNAIAAFGLQKYGIDK